MRPTSTPVMPPGERRSSRRRMRAWERTTSRRWKRAGRPRGAGTAPHRTGRRRRAGGGGKQHSFGSLGFGSGVCAEYQAFLVAPNSVHLLLARLVEVAVTAAAAVITSAIHVYLRTRAILESRSLDVNA